jgi:hypothetical protein
MDWDRTSSEVIRRYRTGEYDGALAIVDGAIDSMPEHMASLVWFRACLLAKSGQAKAALDELARAARSGFWYSTRKLDTEADLDPVRADSRFGVIRNEFVAREAVATVTPPELVDLPSLTGPPAGTLVAFHRAANSPARSMSHWSSAREAGWRVVLPSAPLLLGTEEAAWLTPDGRRLDLDAATTIATDKIRPRVLTEAHLLAAGYAQGAAMALWLALTQALPIAAVLMVGATHRYRDVLEAYTGDATALRVHFVAGDGEIHVDVIDDACRQLSALGAACTVDIREGLGHVFPPVFEHELPRLLSAMTR